MDSVVLQAIAKWPNVPAVYGWLTLDRRGRWLIKGERISNDAVIQFIGRNYEHDGEGRWFFQNGPQRVYVTLDYTPWVLRIEQRADQRVLIAHTGVSVEKIRRALIDDEGSLLLDTDIGVALLSDQDLAMLMKCLETDAAQPLSDHALSGWLTQSADRIYLRWGGARVPVDRIEAKKVSTLFGFNPTPRPAPGEPDC